MPISAGSWDGMVDEIEKFLDLLEAAATGSAGSPQEDDGGRREDATANRG
jgi:hypothetical protein